MSKTCALALVSFVGLVAVFGGGSACDKCDPDPSPAPPEPPPAPPEPPPAPPESASASVKPSSIDWSIALEQQKTKGPSFEGLGAQAKGAGPILHQWWKFTADYDGGHVEGGTCLKSADDPQVKDVESRATTESHACAKWFPKGYMPTEAEVQAASGELATCTMLAPAGPFTPVPFLQYANQFDPDYTWEVPAEHYFLIDDGPVDEDHPDASGAVYADTCCRGTVRFVREHYYIRDTNNVPSPPCATRKEGDKEWTDPTRPNSGKSYWEGIVRNGANAAYQLAVYEGNQTVQDHPQRCPNQVGEPICPYCGDGTCTPGLETHASCPGDCP